MRKPLDYVVVRCANVEPDSGAFHARYFRTKVNELIAKGYEPCGGLAMRPDGTSFQAMCLFEYVNEEVINKNEILFDEVLEELRKKGLPL